MNNRNNNKIDKINSELTKQISYVINYELKDPRINAIITVIKVDTTYDLKIAKVYLSIMSENEVKPEEVIKIIQKAQGFIRNQLKTKLDIRNIPELHFILDDSIQYGMHIEELIKEIHKDDNK